ncbi:MAG: SIS domain-containing protein, partial [Pseudomonadota bacterium]|nr:SIS domain-containing protein [Pseudomonadota bacterium]
ERQPLAAIALPADTATLTAAGNDYDFSQVFARQISGLGKPNDALIVFTTSGQSPNILEAARAATTAGLSVIALTGRDGGALAGLLDTNDLELRVPSDSTARIQEAHAIIIHCICNLIDLHMTGETRL